MDRMEFVAAVAEHAAASHPRVGTRQSLAVRRCCLSGDPARLEIPSGPKRPQARYRKSTFPTACAAGSGQFGEFRLRAVA